MPGVTMRRKNSGDFSWLHGLDNSALRRQREEATPKASILRTRATRVRANQNTNQMTDLLSMTTLNTRARPSSRQLLLLLAQACADAFLPITCKRTHEQHAAHVQSHCVLTPDIASRDSIPRSFSINRSKRLQAPTQLANSNPGCPPPQLRETRSGHVDVLPTIVRRMLWVKASRHTTMGTGSSIERKRQTLRRFGLRRTH